MKSKTIQFSDQLIKLFGLEGDQVMARTVTIQVTDACNLACTYCYQINKCTHSIDIETGKKFIDDLLTGAYGSPPMNYFRIHWRRAFLRN